MGKMKLYELAKEMDVSSKDLLEQAKEMGINIKSHLSVISDEDVKNLKAKYQRNNSDVTKKEEKKPKKEGSQNKDNPVIIRREVIIEEENKEKKPENKPRENKNPFVQRNQKKDYNIVYRNKPTKPMTVSELFGLNKEENKKQEDVEKKEAMKVEEKKV